MILLRPQLRLVAILLGTGVIVASLCHYAASDVAKLMMGDCERRRHCSAIAEAGLSGRSSARNFPFCIHVPRLTGSRSWRSACLSSSSSSLYGPQCFTTKRWYTSLLYCVPSLHIQSRRSPRYVVYEAIRRGPSYPKARLLRSMPGGTALLADLRAYVSPILTTLVPGRDGTAVTGAAFSNDVQQR